MTDIGTALIKLQVTEWVLSGEPTNEAEFNEMFSKVTGEDANGIAIESNNTSDWGVTWSQVSAKKDELVAAEPMRLLREERNRLLAETDYWTLSDTSAATDAQLAYRIALRNIPLTYTSLEDVVWPTKP